jgi:hypothetical protein
MSHLCNNRDYWRICGKNKQNTFSLVQSSNAKSKPELRYSNVCIYLTKIYTYFPCRTYHSTSTHFKCTDNIQCILASNDWQCKSQSSGLKESQLRKTQPESSTLWKSQIMQHLIMYDVLLYSEKEHSLRSIPVWEINTFISLLSLSLLRVPPQLHWLCSVKRTVTVNDKLEEMYKLSWPTS